MAFENGAEELDRSVLLSPHLEHQNEKIMAPAESLCVMLDFLEKMPTVSVVFVNLGSWKLLPDNLRVILQNRSVVLLRSIILSESEHGELVTAPFHHVLDNMGFLSFSQVAELVEVICLTIHSRQVAMDLLLEGLDQRSTMLLTGRPAAIQHFVRNMIGVAVEHIDQVHEEAITRDEMLDIRLDKQQVTEHWGVKVELPFGIDAMAGTPAVNTHVRQLVLVY